jgi:hypothetical protein
MVNLPGQRQAHTPSKVSSRYSDYYDDVYVYLMGFLIKASILWEKRLVKVA